MNMNMDSASRSRYWQADQGRGTEPSELMTATDIPSTTPTKFYRPKVCQQVFVFDVCNWLMPRLTPVNSAWSLT